ncbi:nostrin [Oryzias melastigma]|uniref:Nitric oxide synthase trafficking n=2 Tax=Oryzias melastigma TaxID=30732 RepID=A0A3B3B9P9_ORYME|nr:nostrin [Oryzias melastigma]
MRDVRRRMVKVLGSKSTNGRSAKMKDPIGTCSYNELYQKVKQYSKDGENFFKELMTIFQQRAELELTYAKGLQKLAGRLLKASKGMTKNSTYTAWCHVSDEMYSRADAHRSLGNAFNQEAILEIRQVSDEHSKRKRPLDSVIERNGKLFHNNWSEQLKLKKKLIGLTREHEALYNFVENNKQICTEKEKQKMLNRLTKSAEIQTRVDEEYFLANTKGHQMRLKWENTLKNCYQVILELEKQRIEVLGNILNRYSLHVASFEKTLKHSQKQIEQVVQRVDMDDDIKKLVEENNTTVEDNKAEFLIADYYEEENKSFMSKDRRRAAIKFKLHRLEDTIAKTKKDREGLEKLMKTYAANPSFSNQQNREEIELLLDEITLKLNLLEATSCKLSLTLSEIEGKPKSGHPFSDSISKWKDKDCEHSIIQLTRPVKLRKTPFRTKHSLRASIIYKGPVQILSVSPVKPRGTDPVTVPAKTRGAVEGSSTANAEIPHRASDKPRDETTKVCSLGKCKVLFNFTPEHQNELALKEGDLVDICAKEENGWWFGVLKGQKGHFPSGYVEELPVMSCTQSSEG